MPKTLLSLMAAAAFTAVCFSTLRINTAEGAYAWPPPDAGTGLDASAPDASPSNAGLPAVKMQTTYLLADAVACTIPSGAHCTPILNTTNVAAYTDVTIYVKNVAGWADAGAVTNGPIADILIEVSPNGIDWEEAAANAFDALGTSTIRSVNYVGHFVYLRVEARSVANTTVQVWVSSFHP